MAKTAQAESYPRRKRIRLPADAYGRAGVWYFVTICCRNKEPRLESNETRDLVRAILRDIAKAKRVELAAYSILPNHLHLICSAGRQGLLSFVRELKSRTAVEMIRQGGQGSPWQARFFDHKLRSDESLREKCRYVWMNPVRRGLARRPEDYAWSGAVLSG